MYIPYTQPTWVTPTTRKVTKTTREYDEQGNVIKEIVEEEETTQGSEYTYPYIWSSSTTRETNAKSS